MIRFQNMRLLCIFSGRYVLITGVLLPQWIWGWLNQLCLNFKIFFWLRNKWFLSKWVMSRRCCSHVWQSLVDLQFKVVNLFGSRMNNEVLNLNLQDFLKKHIVSHNSMTGNVNKNVYKCYNKQKRQKDKDDRPQCQVCSKIEY